MGPDPVRRRPGGGQQPQHDRGTQPRHRQRLHPAHRAQRLQCGRVCHLRQGRRPHRLLRPGLGGRRPRPAGPPGGVCDRLVFPGQRHLALQWGSPLRGRPLRLCGHLLRRGRPAGLHHGRDLYALHPRHDSADAAVSPAGLRNRHAGRQLPEPAPVPGHQAGAAGLRARRLPQAFPPAHGHSRRPGGRAAGHR